MHIYKTLQIGEFHTNNCKDFLVDTQIGTHTRLIAVLDGCTMGTESVFAAMLFGKILRYIAKKSFYEAFVSKQNPELIIILRHVIRSLIEEARSMQNHLNLEVNELLATIVLGIVDVKKNEAEFLIVGDGVICKDGEVFSYDQDDKPDYLGYHLTEDFDTWFANQNQRLSVKEFKDISICTDGIFTFRNLVNKQNQKSENEIIKYLLVDSEGAENDNFFDRKIQNLRAEWHHILTDDLAIIRIKTA